MDYKSCCLTCLETDQKTQHVHTVISISGEDIRLSDILLKFYNYAVPSEEHYPDNVCINCVYQLTITYSFKNLIDSCAKTLSDKITCIETSVTVNDEYQIDSEEENNAEKETSKTKRRQSKRSTNKPTINIEDDQKALFCVECKEQFISLQDLNEHCTNNHPVRLLTGRDCDYCSEKFEDFRSLVLHRKLHLHPYVCENCWEGFFSMDELNTHSCLKKDCNKDLDRTDRALKQCDQCGKSYFAGYIRIHMLTHSEDRPYSCKYCQKKFKVPGGLHSHVLWNHKRTRNHTCEICNATFITSSARSSHIRKNHLKEKKYACKCGKRFFSKSELERHMLTHTGVKNFHCHMCDKSYQTRYGLNVHLKSHLNMNVLKALEAE